MEIGWLKVIVSQQHSAYNGLPLSPVKTIVMWSLCEENVNPFWKVGFFFFLQKKWVH